MDQTKKIKGPKFVTEIFIFLLFFSLESLELPNQDLYVVVGPEGFIKYIL